MLLSSQEASGKIVEFNVQAAKDEKYQEIKAIYDQLDFKEALATGSLYVRRDNGELWYIHASETLARCITPEQLDWIYQWDRQPLLPTDQQFEILQAIGGLPSPQYSFDPDHLRFPAKVRTKSGQEIDLCLLHFSAAPPFQRYFTNMLLLDDIAEIWPSELALSHELRLASMLANEIRMSFSPFMVKTGEGKLITYDGPTQFASSGAIKGNEIVSEVPFSYDKLDKISGVNNEEITYVVGKWDDRLQELFGQYKEHLKRKNPENTLSVNQQMLDKIVLTPRHFITVLIGSILTVASLYCWNKIGTTHFFDFNKGGRRQWSIAVFLIIGLLVLVIGIAEIFLSLYLKKTLKGKAHKTEDQHR